MVALALADIDPLGVAPAHGDDGVRHQRVVDDDVGLLEDALGAQRQEIGRAGAGADQPDEAVLGVVRSASRSRVAEAARLLDVAGERGVGDRAIEEGRPEAAARLALRQKPVRGGPEGVGRAGEHAEAHRQQRLDAGADCCASTGPAPVEVIATATGARLTIAGV